jgi:hypothetical protein
MAAEGDSLDNLGNNWPPRVFDRAVFCLLLTNGDENNVMRILTRAGQKIYRIN